MWTMIDVVAKSVYQLRSLIIVIVSIAHLYFLFYFVYIWPKSQQKRFIKKKMQAGETHHEQFFFNDRANLKKKPHHLLTRE